MKDGALRIQEAVIFSGIGRSMLYQLIAKGEIISFKAGGRRLIPREALKIYLEQQLELS